MTNGTNNNGSNSRHYSFSDHLFGTPTVDNAKDIMERVSIQLFRDLQNKVDSPSTYSTMDMDPTVDQNGKR